jgi:uncharacterized protein (DUF1810 family)
MVTYFASGMRWTTRSDFLRMPNIEDPYNLRRFIDAQKSVIETVLNELRSGHKRGHWIWFIFPQLRGLGHSVDSEFYGISGLAEAVAYLRHPVLGVHLKECTQAVNAIEDRTAGNIFGEIDAMKFRSSMTLFAETAPAEPIFREALQKYFSGEPDPLTIGRLQRSG